MYEFKFKIGDIVKVYDEYWPRNAVWHKEYICVIVGQKFFDGDIVHNGIKGEKYPYYRIQYKFDTFGNEVDKYAESPSISPLTEYWYINEQFEVCKETKVKLNEQFIHRACGYGVFLDEDSAKHALLNIQYDNNGANRLFRLLKK